MKVSISNYKKYHNPKLAKGLDLGKEDQPLTPPV